MKTISFLGKARPPGALQTLDLGQPGGLSLPI
jgi:hypothetical protein